MVAITSDLCRPSRVRFATLSAILLLIAVADSAEASITLRLPNVSVEAGNVIEFVCSEEVAPTATPASLVFETPEHHFKYSVDVAELEWDERCGCLRSYTFQFQQVGQPAIVAFKVRALVKAGNVHDQWTEVRFFVDAGDVHDTG